MAGYPQQHGQLLRFTTYNYYRHHSTIGWAHNCYYVLSLLFTSKHGQCQDDYVYYVGLDIVVIVVINIVMSVIWPAWTWSSWWSLLHQHLYCHQHHHSCYVVVVIFLYTVFAYTYIGKRGKIKRHSERGKERRTKSIKRAWRWQTKTKRGKRQNWWEWWSSYHPRRGNSACC